MTLALLSTFISIRLGIATALSEILVDMIAQALIVFYFVDFSLGTHESLITFLAGSGAIVLTFLAGAELDPLVLRSKWKEVSLIGIAAFFVPFFGCTAVAYDLLNWNWNNFRFIWIDSWHNYRRTILLFSCNCNWKCGYSYYHSQCILYTQTSFKRYLSQEAIYLLFLSIILSYSQFT